MVADMDNDKTLHSVVTELFIKDRKLILLWFLSQVILPVTKGCKTKHYTLLYYE